MAEEKKGPEMSALVDGDYRYALRRVYSRPEEDDELALMPVCMLNPSIADASIDDPTIRKLKGFIVDRWGYDGFTVVNLFAFRATFPGSLIKVADPVGPRNDEAIAAALADAAGGTMLVGWGANLEDELITPRAKFVVETARRYEVTLKCLGVTNTGRPGHPLYLPYDRKLIDFEWMPGES